MRMCELEREESLTASGGNQEANAARLHTLIFPLESLAANPGDPHHDGMYWSARDA